MPSGNHISLSRCPLHDRLPIRSHESPGAVTRRRAGGWSTQPIWTECQPPAGSGPARAGGVGGAAALAAGMVGGDEARAWAAVAATRRRGGKGWSAPTVYVDLLVRARRAIGDGRAAGELTVADETSAVAVPRRLVGRLALRETASAAPPAFVVFPSHHP